MGKLGPVVVFWDILIMGRNTNPKFKCINYQPNNVWKIIWSLLKAWQSREWSMMDLVVEILGIKNAMFAWAFAWYDIVAVTVDLGVTGFGDLWVKGRLWWQIELLTAGKWRRLARSRSEKRWQILGRLVVWMEVDQWFTYKRKREEMFNEEERQNLRV